MNIIAFLNQKGGVGKTTSAVNIGAILAMEHGRRVLLVDLDPQGNLSDHLGVYPEDGRKTVYDVLISGTPAREALRHAHGMDVIPANVDLAAAEVELAGMLSRETRLKKAIAPLCQEYDYVLLDCPPSLGLLTICALTLAQSVIVPMEAEYLALKGLSQLTNTIQLVAEDLNQGLRLGGVLFCMYSGNSTLARSVRHDVEEYFPGIVFETCIRRNVRLAEAPSHEMPINVYDVTCAGADDYRLATEEIIARYEGDEAKKKIAPNRPPAARPETDLTTPPEPRPASETAPAVAAPEEDGEETAPAPETPLIPEKDDDAAAAAPAANPVPETSLETAMTEAPEGAPFAEAAETLVPGETPCLYRRHAAAPRKPSPDLPPIWKGDPQ